MGKWGRARIFFSLFKQFFLFNVLLFQFSRENGWKSVYRNGILCLKAVKFVLWNNSQLRNVIGCADCQPTCFHSFTLSCVGVPVPCVPGVPASSRTFLLFYPYVFVCYPYVARMYSYVTRMLPVCDSYVVVCYLYVLVWCFSHDRWLGRGDCRRYLVSVTALTAHWLDEISLFLFMHFVLMIMAFALPLLNTKVIEVSHLILYNWKACCFLIVGGHNLRFSNGG